MGSKFDFGAHAELLWSPSCSERRLLGSFLASWLRLGRFLGASWRLLTRLGRVLGRLGRILGASWRVLGVSWGVEQATLSRLVVILGDQGAI